MNDTFSWFLLVVFLIHLIVFARLAIRRREGYYVALVTTFGLLVASNAVRLMAPELEVFERALFQWLRWTAWLAALVSISWGIRRYIQRRRDHRQPG